MDVPVRPAMPSRAFSNSVMRAVRPALEQAKATAAWTLGSMEPGANWPSAIYSSASVGVRLSSHAITKDQSVTVIDVLKLSKYMESPTNQRGKARPYQPHGKGKRKHK